MKKEAFLSDSLSFLQGKCADVVGNYPNAKIWQRTTSAAGCTVYCLDSSSGTCEEVSPECNYDNLIQNCGGSCSCTSWVTGGCGTNGCTANSKSRIRTCAPDGCNTDLECYSDSSCGSINCVNNQQITTPCICGGSLHSTGYCCNNAYQSSACGNNNGGGGTVDACGNKCMSFIQTCDTATAKCKTNSFIWIIGVALLALVAIKSMTKRK